MDIKSIVNNLSAEVAALKEKHFSISVAAPPAECEDETQRKQLYFASPADGSTIVKGSYYDVAAAGI